MTNPTNPGRETLKAVNLLNPLDVVYVKGNADEEGSVRLGVGASGRNCVIQFRQDGLFRPTGIELNPDTLLLGLDLSVNAQGSALKINSKETGTTDITIGAEFNDVGAGPAKVPIMGTRINRLVVVSNTTGEFVTKLRESTFTASAKTSINRAFRYKFYFKTGSIAATTPITLEISKGFSPGGEVILREVMPASQWSANTEVEVELLGGLNLSPGGEFLSSLFSDEDFSLIGDNANGGQFFAFDVQPYIYEALISASHGTNKFLISNDSEFIIDENGNILLSGGQFTTGDMHSHQIPI